MSDLKHYLWAGREFAREQYERENYEAARTKRQQLRRANNALWEWSEDVPNWVIPPRYQIVEAGVVYWSHGNDYGLLVDPSETVHAVTFDAENDPSSLTVVGEPETPAHTLILLEAKLPENLRLPATHRRWLLDEEDETVQPGDPTGNDRPDGATPENYTPPAVTPPVEGGATNSDEVAN